MLSRVSLSLLSRLCLNGCNSFVTGVPPNGKNWGNFHFINLTYQDLNLVRMAKGYFRFQEIAHGQCGILKQKRQLKMKRLQWRYYSLEIITPGLYGWEHGVPVASTLLQVGVIRN